MLKYFAQLSTGKTILWCYLIWYVMTVCRYFDPTPAIWLNSLGISIVIGLALILSVSNADGRTDPWQTFRLFLMPFCVSSFSSLIKGQGFFLVFPPTFVELAVSLAACAVFVGAVMSLRYFARSRAS
jgi:hypothetical protein